MLINLFAKPFRGREQIESSIITISGDIICIPTSRGQERLLLSVLPRFIALKIVREVENSAAEDSDDLAAAASSSSSAQFGKIYLERCDNVRSGTRPSLWLRHRHRSHSLLPEPLSSHATYPFVTPLSNPNPSSGHPSTIPFAWSPPGAEPAQSRLGVWSANLTGG